MDGSQARRSSPARWWLPWLLGWFGMVVLALLNGTLRALVTQPWLGEEVARRLATVVLLSVLTAYVWLLHRRYPLPSARSAWAVGLAWAAMTLTFEFGFGGLVEGLSWTTMLADYDVTRGRIWVLVPLWTTAVVAVVHARQRAGVDAGVSAAVGAWPGPVARSGAERSRSGAVPPRRRRWPRPAGG